MLTHGLVLDQVTGHGVHRRALVEPVDGAAGPDGVGQRRHEEAGPGTDVEDALSRLGGEERENLGALLHDVGRRVDALDLSSSVFVELEHRHADLLSATVPAKWRHVQGSSSDALAALHRVRDQHVARGSL